MLLLVDHEFLLFVQNKAYETFVYENSNVIHQFF